MNNLNTQTKKSRSKKPKSNSEDSGNYTGLEKDLVDLTAHYACAQLAWGGMFKGGPEVDLVINQCWGDAKGTLELDGNSYPIDSNHRKRVCLFLAALNFLMFLYVDQASYCQLLKSGSG